MKSFISVMSLLAVQMVGFGAVCKAGFSLSGSPDSFTDVFMYQSGLCFKICL